MVYHVPGTEPLGNAWWLGPLRIFTCDEAAIALPRSLAKLFTRYLVYAFGVGKIVERVAGSCGCIPKIVSVLTPFAGPNVPIAQRVINLFLFSLGVKFAKHVWDKWSSHMRFIDLKPKQFFWETDEEGNAPEGARGVLFYSKPKNLPPNATPADVKTVMINKKWNRSYAWPIVSVEQGYLRGFNLVGMRLSAFLCAEFTLGLEFPLTALTRVLLHYCWIPAYNNPKADRYAMYKAVINTSLGCFVDYDKSHADTYGHVVLTDLVLPYNQVAMRVFKSIVIHLDHVNECVSKVVLTHYDFDNLPVVETYGSAVDEENTYRELAADSPNGIALSERQNLEQMGEVLIACLTLYTHTAVHWWANGTAVIEDSSWPLKRKSTDVTQWVNTQAVFLSWMFFGSTEQILETVLVNNNSEGLPAPEKTASHTELYHLVESRSPYMRMTAESRKRLAAKLDDRAQDADAIVAATVMHSAEHYYAAQYLPIFATSGSIMPLKTDMSGFSMSVVAPMHFWSRRLLVRQHRHRDDTCAELYEICAGVDKHFADCALTIGCAF